jgi:hypothetical protein
VGHGATGGQCAPGPVPPQLMLITIVVWIMVMVGGVAIITWLLR